MAELPRALRFILFLGLPLCFIAVEKVEVHVESGNHSKRFEVGEVSRLFPRHSFVWAFKERGGKRGRREREPSINLSKPPNRPAIESGLRAGAQEFAWRQDAPRGCHRPRRHTTRDSS